MSDANNIDEGFDLRGTQEEKPKSKPTFGQKLAQMLAPDYKDKSDQAEELTRQIEELRATILRMEEGSSEQLASIEELKEAYNSAQEHLADWISWAQRQIEAKGRTDLLLDGVIIPDKVQAVMDEELHTLQRLVAKGPEIAPIYEGVLSRCDNVNDALALLEDMLMDAKPAMPQSPSVEKIVTLDEILANPSSEESIELAKYREQAVKSALIAFGLPTTLSEVKAMLSSKPKPADTPQQKVVQTGCVSPEYGKMLMHMMRGIRDAVAGIASPATQQTIGMVVNERILVNDYYGLDDFIARLGSVIEKQAKSAQEVKEAVQSEFARCLGITSATWIDNLVRLHAYACVPFINEQFEAKGVNVGKIFAAYALLETLLGYLGITLAAPRLFADEFDPTVHDAEPIKNITELVDDVAAHVEGDNQIIDIFTVGFSVDGVLKEKPAVSRINN